jgi:hypothetical protein
MLVSDKDIQKKQLSIIAIWFCKKNRWKIPTNKTTKKIITKYKQANKQPNRNNKNNN